MDPAVTSARHFARLVSVLLHEPANVDEQKVTLRALAMATKEAALALVANDQQLGANGMVVSTAFAGVGDVTARMAAHGLRGIDVGAGAGPGELLGVARLLASSATPNDGGVAAEAQRVAIGAKSITFTRRSAPGALPDLELLEPSDDDIAAAPRRPRTSIADLASRGDNGMLGQLKPARGATSAPGPLIEELRTVTDGERMDHLLDDLVASAEQAVAEARPTVVVEILQAMVQRDTEVTESHEKRLFAMALRRVAKAPMLQAVARQLPRTPDRRDALLAVLTRMGEDGADAVIEQLTTVSQQSDRRAYFDALLALQAGIPTLIHMLGDTRWYVARNAADLLGEMQAKEAEQPLTWLLQNEDDRVRRSATTALMRLGTPRALQAILDTLRDGVPAMRIQASAALVARQDVRTASALVRALETEKDEEVQEAFLVALGGLATPDAVQRLLVAAEPERGFFRSKRTSWRLAAVQGLAEARTKEAVDGLTVLLTDKEGEVKDAATYALARVKERGVRE